MVQFSFGVSKGRVTVLEGACFNDIFALIYRDLYNGRFSSRIIIFGCIIWMDP